MKLFAFLHKSDWEHKDPSVRLRAAQDSEDPALLALLPELAQTDPEPAVRIAALRRVDDLNLLARRMRGELDPRVAAAARERLVACLCDPRFPLDARRAAMLDLPDPEVLARVAAGAADAPMRRIALEQIDRPGQLFERCLADPDPDVRLWLLERIDAPDALQRLAEAARRRDKTLARAARERLEALLVAAGDPAALQRAALSLCERAGRLARELPSDREQQLQALAAQWSELSPRVDADLQRRTGGALDMAAAAIGASRAAAVPTNAVIANDDAAAETDAAADEDIPAPAVHEDVSTAGTVLSQSPEAPPGNGIAAEIDSAAEQRSERAARAQQQRVERQAAAETQLEAMQAALDANNLAAARAARSALVVSHFDVPQKRRLAVLDQQLARLDEWQRWSGNEARARLCEQAAALQGSGLHPDALATRVKELQVEWARLDSIDGEAAPAADSGPVRRFRGLCHAALKPARNYFDKRREVRGERAGQIDTLLAEADATIEAGAPAALPILRRRIVEALRDLDSVAPEKRGGQGRALRAALARIDQAIAGCREDAALEKRKLIAKLRRELGTADAEAAIALAKDAQSQWKRLARGERAQEEALWTELRTLIGPLFAGAREREQQRRDQNAEAEATARAVLQELDALAGADRTRLAHAEAHLEALGARWRALQPSEEVAAPARGRGGSAGRDARSPGSRRDGGERRGEGGRDGRKGRPAAGRAAHPLEAQFTAAVARVEAARARAAAERERAAMQSIATAGEILDALAATADAAARDVLLARFAAINLPADARLALQPRLEQQSEAAPGADPHPWPARLDALAVRAELLAGLDSPPDCAALRRQEQMQRLAARLEGSEQRAPAEELRALLVEFESQPGPQRERRAQLRARILKAYAQVGPGNHDVVD